LASATGAFAGPPDSLDPLFRMGSRIDDLSPYPGPRLTTPSPTYPSRPAPESRERAAAGRELEAMDPLLEEALTPRGRALKRAYDTYGKFTPSTPTAGDIVCFKHPQCAALVDAAWPETSSTLADTEREDTIRARKEKANADWFLDGYDSPYAVPPASPSAHLRTRPIRSRASMEVRQQELQRREQWLIRRDRRPTRSTRDDARLNDQFLDDIQRKLSDPTTDPSQRNDLYDAAELLRRNQQYYREQGAYSPPPDSYVAPQPLPVYQPRQAPVVLPPSDPSPRGGGGGRGARRAD
jgi:hypothetical protein